MTTPSQLEEDFPEARAKLDAVRFSQYFPLAGRSLEAATARANLVTSHSWLIEIRKFEDGAGYVFCVLTPAQGKRRHTSQHFVGFRRRAATGELFAACDCAYMEHAGHRDFCQHIPNALQFFLWLLNVPARDFLQSDHDGKTPPTRSNLSKTAAAEPPLDAEERAFLAALTETTEEE